MKDNCVAPQSQFMRKIGKLGQGRKLWFWDTSCERHCSPVLDYGFSSRVQKSLENGYGLWFDIVDFCVCYKMQESMCKSLKHTVLRCAMVCSHRTGPLLRHDEHYISTNDFQFCKVGTLPSPSFDCITGGITNLTVLTLGTSQHQH